MCKMFQANGTNLNHASNSYEGGSQPPAYKQFMSFKPVDFKGSTDPMVAEEWMQSMETISEFMQCSNSDRLRCASFMFKDDARIWWQGAKSTLDLNAATWEEFKVVFYGKYFTLSTRNKLVREFLEIRQGDSTAAASRQPLSRGFRTPPFISSFLLEKRRINVTGLIDDENVESIIFQLMYFEYRKPKAPIQMIINSGGGLITSGLAVYDQMKALKCPVHTCCVGNAASMAAVLLAGGEKEFRYASANSSVMIHSAIGGYQGSSKDVQITFNQLMAEENKIVLALARDTGSSIDVIRKCIERDNFMSPQQAKHLGLIDIIGILPLILSPKHEHPKADNDMN
ncbi:ATP-dependent Clp protease proteolytic subunit-like [Impatiens glandulifera]|uniref:ATP-dependent Clp protease proteolytic subunit-like n=1 Tax=Impatiens glandulifera TaxID=253017 RepID=UPI001FB096F1|nr:ATP-dependent Clp protease proteolytic subunit-like [Impatiens glandulifera]